MEKRNAWPYVTHNNYNFSTKAKFYKNCRLVHGYQNPDLDHMILRFCDPTYPKRSGTFKDFCDRVILTISNDLGFF